MSNFKMKLAFFQNNIIQQPNSHPAPSHQPPSHLPSSIQQQPARPQQAYPQAIRPLAASKQVVIQETLGRPQPTHIAASIDNQANSNVKPSIVVPKSNENSGFKAKLAFFGQQQSSLPPLQSRQPTLSQKLPPIDHAANQNYKTEETFATNSSIAQTSNPILSSKVNNENIPQPLISDFKQQQHAPPPKSFKDKLALISTLQQPMGTYDYKKKKATYAQPINNDPPVPTPTFQSITNTESHEQVLPSLRAPNRRAPQRRPPSLIQPTG